MFSFLSLFKFYKSKDMKNIRYKSLFAKKKY